MFPTVGAKNSLVDRVVEAIREQITQGGIKPGEMLPPERELCDQLGVSRTALREAVRMLASKGLLETRPGVGTFVRGLNSNHVFEPLSILVQTSKGGITLDHLHEVRNILEVENARQAAEKAGPEDIQRIQILLEQMEESQEDGVRFTALDTEFHRLIAEITHNPLLALLLDTMRDLMSEVREQVWQYQNLSAIVSPDHHQIGALIAAHRPAEAAQAMQAHLEHARSIQHEVLEQAANHRSDTLSHE
jgi:GntR family transcriptional repressor for pyruvate dehydrogenase complex